MTEMDNNVHDDNMHISINNYCRLCANIDESMIPIYDDQGADHMLEYKIKKHLPFLNVLYTLYLPTIIYHNLYSL